MNDVPIIMKCAKRAIDWLSSKPMGTTLPRKMQNASNTAASNLCERISLRTMNNCFISC